MTDVIQETGNNKTANVQRDKPKDSSPSRWGSQGIKANVNKEKANNDDKKREGNKAGGEEEKNTRKAEQGEARGDSSKVRRTPWKRKHTTM